jgi:hypothetical protein
MKRRDPSAYDSVRPITLVGLDLKGEPSRTPCAVGSPTEMALRRAEPAEPSMPFGSCHGAPQSLQMGHSAIPLRALHDFRVHRVGTTSHSSDRIDVTVIEYGDRQSLAGG